MYKKTVLKNGLRIITIPMENTKTVSVLALIGTGSKYETKDINGISHFLEHMFFKGTKRYPTTLKIAERLDNIGGAYNAFTSKELTGFWAKVGKKHLNLAMDWISDILLNSKFEEKEIKREKGVIIEEFNMYLDNPMSYIDDLWEKLLYGNQPAGWLTLGEKKNILKFKRKDFLDYFKKYYLNKNIVICVAGNFDNKKIIKKIEKYFNKFKNGEVQEKIKTIENQKIPETLIHYKKTDQTHICLGVKGYNLFDSEKYAQIILSTILGANMSSRLFTLIRERKGLCYYIRTSSDSSTDTGYLVTQAGIPHKNLEQVIKLIIREYKKFKTRRITEKELQKAKDYLKGTFNLKLESSDFQASFYSLEELLTNKILTPEEKFAKLDKVTISDVQKIAQNIFKSEKLNLAIIGPHKSKSKFQSLLKI
jgi:predicted Zn-dependent peptidase